MTWDSSTHLIWIINSSEIILKTRQFPSAGLQGCLQKGERMRGRVEIESGGHVTGARAVWLVGQVATTGAGGGGAIKLFLAIDWSRRFPVDPSAPAQVTRAPQVVTGSKVSALDREPVNTHKNFIVTHSSFMWESQPATGLRPWFCPLEILIYPIYKKKNRLCVLHHSFSHVRIIHQHKLIKKQHLTLDNDV